MRWLTKLEQQAMGDAGSCWEDVDAVAVANGRLSAGWSWLWRRWRCGSSSAVAAARKEEQKLEMRHGMDRAGAGGVKAALWLITATVGRTSATHGQFPRHAAARL